MTMDARMVLASVVVVAVKCGRVTKNFRRSSTYGYSM
jgi:hypothetical protein